MTQKKIADPVKAYFERQIFLNEHLLRIVKDIYFQHGHMLAMNYTGSDEDIIQVNIRPLGDAQQECSIVLLGLPNHRFDLICFHREDRLSHATCTSASLNGPRLTRFFAKAQTSVLAALAAAGASPAKPAPFPEGKGFVQRVKKVVQVSQLNCYEITLHNDVTITYQLPENVPMKIVPGVWLYGDGNGTLEQLAQRAPH